MQVQERSWGSESVFVSDIPKINTLFLKTALTFLLKKVLPAQWYVNGFYHVQFKVSQLLFLGDKKKADFFVDLGPKAHHFVNSSF